MQRGFHGSAYSCKLNSVRPPAWAGVCAQPTVVNRVLPVLWLAATLAFEGSAQARLERQRKPGTVPGFNSPNAATLFLKVGELSQKHGSYAVPVGLRAGKWSLAHLIY